MLYLKIHHQTQDHQDFLLCCLLEVFLIWGCKFRSMIIWGSIFVKSVRSVSRFFFFFFFCMWMSICSSTIFWKDYPFSVELLLLLYQISVDSFVWVYFFALCSVPWSIIYLLFHQNHTVLITVALLVIYLVVYLIKFI